MLATFLHMLQGTPYVYQGEEIGMTNVGLRHRSTTTATSRPSIMYREVVDERGMDPARGAWQHGPRQQPRQCPHADAVGRQRRNAGFTTGTPWINVNPNYPEINAAQALADPDSIFYYYQQLIRLRKENPILVAGRYDLLLEDDDALYAFTRTLGDERLLVILNFTAGIPLFSLPEGLPASAPELLIANYPVADGESIERITLRPYEARVYRLR